jgi:transcriptional regulator GlxA family with amidase domain
MNVQLSAGASDRGPVARQRLQSAIANISLALDHALEEQRTGAVLHLRRAEEFLRPVPADLSPTRNPGPKLIAWKLRRVLAHMDANLATSLRNRELAALVNLSEFHFNVAFRNSVGATPHEFLIRRRIGRAQELMRSTHMPLCEIATDCGLADQAHLSRLFRKVVGETPAAWRKRRSYPENPGDNP